MGKLLTILGVSEEKQKGLPNDVFQSEMILDGLQKIYANSPESFKKDQLALAISEGVKVLMARVNPLIRDEKKEEEIKKEEEKLPEEPKEDMPKEQPKPEEKPKKEKKKKEDKKEEKPPAPQPESPHKAVQDLDNCDDIKDAIKGLNLLAKLGDEEAQEIVKQLKIKLKTIKCK
jgi:outer membrane biosynthesis protein TonB